MISPTCCLICAKQKTCKNELCDWKNKFNALTKKEFIAVNEAIIKYKIRIAHEKNNTRT
jgi:hypothetical protein